MPIAEIRSGVYFVGSIDWDRRLFDELIPLPDGTSYNSYIVKGSKKTALIDTVDPSKEEELLNNLNELKIEQIDYLIANHAEQDHSGTIPKILKKYPEAKVVTNPKCSNFLKDLLLLSDDSFQLVNDGENLSLGDKTLEFVIAPWVHWPETMLTYLKEDKILFTCDLFGSHLATSDLYLTDEKVVYPAAKRYYAEIMMPFRNNIKGHIKKIENREIDIIATSHGPLYDKPEFILDSYRDWISDRVKNEVVLPYVSMHGSTKKMVDYFIESLITRDITVKPFNLTVTDIGELAMAIVDAATIVIGTPTVLVGPHPSAVYAAYLVGVLRPKTKFLSIVGSYGWGSKMVDIISDLTKNLKAEVIEPVITKGHPKSEDFAALDRLADEIQKRYKDVAAQ